VNELLSCKDEYPFNDKYYTILEKSYIIHTWQSMLLHKDFCTGGNRVEHNGRVHAP